MKKKITLNPGKLGITFGGSPPRISKVSGSSPLLGLVEVSDSITGLIIPGVIELSGFGTAQLSSLLSKYSSVEGRILLLSGTDRADEQSNDTPAGGFGSHVILKKTWKVKEFNVATEKSFSFHGGVPASVVDAVNENLATIRSVQGAGTVRFSLDQNGHYYASMTHNYQKYREEDALVCIFDTMESMGYRFYRQFDSEMASSKVIGGSSYTAREMFLFHKE